ncbi:hypothetical protein ACHAXT_011456 [Thalassiosira profunda]
MSLSSRPLITLLAILAAAIACTDAFTAVPSPPTRPLHSRIATVLSAASGTASGAQEAPKPPKTFREGEVMGLRLMQAGQYDDALKAFKLAMTLPGSRPDIVRTANVPGPSPVGGSKGGTEGRSVQNLDEFEYQAAHYNMACANAALGNIGEAVANLRKAFEYGFDNYATVRADPDLASVRGSAEFERLMEEFDPRRGFNPFGAFRK